jgi:hypothetical protein
LAVVAPLEMPLVPDQIPYLAPLLLPVAVAAVLRQTQTVVVGMAALAAAVLGQPITQAAQVTRQAPVRRKAQTAAQAVTHRDLAQAAVVALRQRATMALVQQAATAAQAQHPAYLARL